MARVFQPGDLPSLHHLGAAVSFTGICFYTLMLTALTRLCTLSGHERILYPLRFASTALQITITICCILHGGFILRSFYNPGVVLVLHLEMSDAILYAQTEYFYKLLAAVFEWMLSINLQLFELSYTVEFCFFSSFMLANIFGKQEDEKPLMLTMSWGDAALNSRCQNARD